jgi:mevalonate pyrophosphate decarboxylase
MRELSILWNIGNVFPQKGGTAIVTIGKNERRQWIAATKRALEMLADSQEDSRADIKRAKKTLLRLNKHLMSAAPPYLVINEEEEKVITCGHSHISNLLKK